MTTNLTTKQYVFGDIGLELYGTPRVFEPNLTTRMLAAAMQIQPGQQVLDLGCGVGPLAIIAAKLGAAEVVAIDIMPEACELAEENARLNGVQDKVRVVQGDLFEKLRGEKFDVIVNDVSGMAEDVSRISPWYPPSIPTGGRDGTGPTIRMLTEVQNFLKQGGLLYFPVLSLANYHKILDYGRRLFKQMEAVAQRWVPFCKEFKQLPEKMDEMKEAGIIDFIMRRTHRLWNLEIYRATF